MGNVPEPVLEGKYFTGWDRLITFVTSSVTVKATYNSSTVKIEFRDPENGEAMLKEVSVNYNEASSTLVGPSIIPSIIQPANSYPLLVGSTVG